jgi:hypothetical protein
MKSTGFVNIVNFDDIYPSTRDILRIFSMSITVSSSANGYCNLSWGMLQTCDTPRLQATDTSRGL